MHESDRLKPRMIAFMLRQRLALEYWGRQLLKWGPPQIAYLWWIPDLVPKNGLVWRVHTRGGCNEGSGKI